MYCEGVLQVRLLGGAAAERDGEQLSLPPPAGRLLALLAVRLGSRDREAVAAHLWPGAAGAAARANLRTAMWALRKAVGDDVLIASRTTVGLRPEAVTVDIADCRRRAAAGDLAAAAVLCRGELLAGNAEDWAEAARRELREELAEVLDARAAAAEREGDAATAARWSRLCCALDPLNEAAHAALVRQLAAAGDRAGALVAGREVTTRLHDELGVRPGPMLRAALAEARGGPGDAAVLAGPAAARPLFGRAAELRTLMTAWTAARAGHGRVVLVTGEAGIGKTRLVAELAHRADNAGRGSRSAPVSMSAVRRRWPCGRNWCRSLPGPCRSHRSTPAGLPSWAGWPPKSPRGSGGTGRRRRCLRRSWSGCGCSMRCCGWWSGRRPAGRCSWWPRTCTVPTRSACSCARTSAGGWLPGRCCSC
jgi:DNA-binding SARP family transcriptional activator